MLAYELFEILKEKFGVKEAIVRVNDLMMELDYNPAKYILELSQECEETSFLNNICPLCGEDLVEFVDEENRGEYQGFDCFEKMYRYECLNPECTYTRE